MKRSRDLLFSGSDSPSLQEKCRQDSSARGLRRDEDTSSSHYRRRDIVLALMYIHTVTEGRYKHSGALAVSTAVSRADLIVTQCLERTPSSIRRHRGGVIRSYTARRGGHQVVHLIAA